MKTFLLLLATTLGVGAASVRVAWDDTNNVGVTYKVYYGRATATYTNTVLAGTNKVVDITGLASGTRYYFAVTAVAPDAESNFSNEINHLTPLTPPVQRSVTNITQVAVGVNGPWVNLAVTVVDIPEGYTFARGKLFMDEGFHAVVAQPAQLPPLPPGFR